MGLKIYLINLVDLTNERDLLEISLLFTARETGKKIASKYSLLRQSSDVTKRQSNTHVQNYCVSNFIGVKKGIPLGLTAMFLSVKKTKDSSFKDSFSAK